MARRTPRPSAQLVAAAPVTNPAQAPADDAEPSVEAVTPADAPALPVSRYVVGVDNAAGVGSDYSVETVVQLPPEVPASVAEALGAVPPCACGVTDCPGHVGQVIAETEADAPAAPVRAFTLTGRRYKIELQRTLDGVPQGNPTEHASYPDANAEGRRWRDGARPR